MRKFYTLLLSIAVLATACTTDTTQDIGVVGDDCLTVSVEKNGYVQPYFDPVSSSFVFQLVYYYSNTPWLYNDAFDLNAPIE